MDRKLYSTVLSIVLVLMLLAGAVTPALAEAPPPPADEGGAPAAAPAPSLPEDQPAGPEKEPAPAEASPIVPIEALTPAADLGQWVSPPVREAGAVSPATTAAFVSDEQMLDAGGVPRAQGETLAALFAVGAIACPAGKVPLIYNGSSDTGCTPYYNLNPGVNNPIELAQAHALTKTGWWIWVSPNYSNTTLATYLTKSVTVKGDPLGTSVAGSIALDYSNITLRDLAVQNGRITSNGQSGTLRLQGVTVTGTFLNQYGIDITGHRGSISLANVTVAIASGKGALLDAASGNGTVTVLNSAFKNNPNGDGLHILANNAVKVENVSASGNGKTTSGSGLYIEYRTRLTLKNIYAYNNRTWGIRAIDTHPTIPGPVTLANIDASENDSMDGIRLISPGAVSGSNLILSYNGQDDGIEVQAGRGSVTLSGVTAIDNIWLGLNINTSGSVSVSNSRVAANHWVGLSIINKGAVSVKNSLFTTNTSHGVYIDNSAAATPQGVTLTNLNVVQNGGYGIWVNATGTLTLSGISSRANGYAGAWLQTGGGATVSGSNGANLFYENGTSTFCVNTPDVTCSGLYVDARNTASVSNVTSNNNRGHGVKIVNASSARVTNTTVLDNYALGVWVIVKGNIVVDRVTALRNSWGLALYNIVCTGSPSMTISHVLADQNRGPGVEIYAACGPVTLNHVSASHNNEYGIYVDNTLGTSGVTLTNSLGSDLVSYNVGSNLSIFSNGAVSVRGVNASGSASGCGARIDNTTSASSAGVSVSSSDFNGNGNDSNDHGLLVTSKGSITLNTVNANNNREIGAFLQNHTTALNGKSVSVSKGSFRDNYNMGLAIISRSAVTLNNVTANGNLGRGAEVNNYLGGAGTGNVTVSSSLGRNQFSDNAAIGLYISTGGSLSISNTEANGNGSVGVFSAITIFSYGTAKTATFTCVSASNNSLYGIDLSVQAGSIKPTLKGVWLGGNANGGLNYPGTVIYYHAVTCP